MPSIVGGFDIHRKQLTFDYLDTVAGEVRRGQITPADRGHLRQFWLHAEQSAHSLRSRDPRCGPRGRVRLSARRPAPGGVRCGHGASASDALHEQRGRCG